MAHNIRTGLKRRAGSMAQYDRLPAELRRWLAQAALPWSTRSALRHWQRALRQARGDCAAAARLLSQLEARNLARDRPLIWGGDYPPPAGPCARAKGPG